MAFVMRRHPGTCLGAALLSRRERHSAIDQMVLYSAADLLWATRIKATADAMNIPCRPARSPDMLRARLADSDVRGLIVDLDAPDVALALIEVLRRGTPLPADGPGSQAAGSPPAGPAQPPLDPDGKVRILAFGPHVAVDLFEKARRAGADIVLARGAFDRRLPDILRDLAGTPPVDGPTDGPA